MDDKNAKEELLDEIKQNANGEEVEAISFHWSTAFDSKDSPIFKEDQSYSLNEVSQFLETLCEKDGPEFYAWTKSFVIERYYDEGWVYFSCRTIPRNPP